MPSFEAWGNTDPGNVRKNNEDAWLIDPALSLAVVADGMGGAACGEVASAITAETISEYLRENDDGEKDAPTLIAEAIGLANRRVLDKARVSTDCKGMGSTVVLALLRNPLISFPMWGQPRLSASQRRADATLLRPDPPQRTLFHYSHDARGD